MEQILEEKATVSLMYFPDDDREMRLGQGFRTEMMCESKHLVLYRASRGKAVVNIYHCHEEQNFLFS